MATYRQQQQFIYSICMASKQCREERERAEHSTHSYSTQLSVNSVCPLPAFRSPLLSLLQAACWSAGKCTGKCFYQRSSIARTASSSLSSSSSCYCFSCCCLWFTHIAKRIQLRLSWITLLDKRHLALIVTSSSATPSPLLPLPSPCNFYAVRGAPSGTVPSRVAWRLLLLLKGAKGSAREVELPLSQRGAHCLVKGCCFA